MIKEIQKVVNFCNFQNFREDYCRFEFTLLDNLESIQTLEDCQTACSYLTNCTFFFYDKDAKICKVNTSSIENRVCDMVHGTKEPALKDCLDAGKVQWSNPGNYLFEFQHSTLYI